MHRTRLHKQDRRGVVRPIVLAMPIAMRAIPLAMAAVLVIGFAYVPFFPVPAAGVDDGLYARQAVNILRYGWLGSYDYMTLEKGPFYPLFLAASSLSGLPFLVVQGALYAGASLGLARAVGMLSGSLVIEFIGASLLLLNPMLFEMDMLHVLREGIYVSLTMLVVALTLLCGASQDRRPARRTLRAGAAGTALAAFWLTREEGVWLLPSLLFIAGLHVLSVRSQGYRAILRACLVFATMGGIAAAWVGAVCLTNEWQYGVGEVVELKQTEFIDAYSAHARIQHTGAQRHRRLTYRVRAFRGEPNRCPALAHSGRRMQNELAEEGLACYAPVS